MAKAIIFVKTRISAQLDGDGAQQGDLLNIYPFDKEHCIGSGMYRSMMPLFMNDLKIPCGDGVKDAAGTWEYNDRGPLYNCGRCKYNDIDDCDKVKYLKGVWEGGDLHKEPTLKRKCMYRIDYKSFIPTNVKDICNKLDVSEQEKSTLDSYATANEISNVLIKVNI